MTTSGLTRRNALRLAALPLASAAWARPAAAQAWPTRPVRIVVPYAAGGATDTMARMVAERLTHRLGQNVVVENRAGAGGAIGAQAVVQAERDGHMLLFSGGSLFAAVPLMQRLSFDPVKDLQGVSIVGVNGVVMVAAPSFAPRTVAEVIAWGKANPGKLNCAAAGNGTSSHIAGVIFQERTGLDMVIVPYAGAAAANADVIAGRVHIHFGSVADLLPYAGTGSMNLLAITSRQRIPQAPDLPIMTETIPGLVYEAWNGLIAPTGVPAPVIALLSRHVMEIAREPDFVQRLGGLGIQATGSTVKEVEEMLAYEKPLYAAAIKSAGLGYQP
jgi:tripartite-type tricarboxylate transporter receptor subunit TctC